MADRLEQPPVIEPVHPFHGGVFNGVDVPPRATATDHFRLVQAVDRFRQGAVIGVATTADRRVDARLSRPLRMPDRQVRTGLPLSL